METERDLIIRAANIETLREFLPCDYECDEYLESLKQKSQEAAHRSKLFSGGTNCSPGKCTKHPPSTTENYAQKGGGQREIHGQCVFRVGNGRRSTFGKEISRTSITVFALFDGVESLQY